MLGGGAPGFSPSDLVVQVKAPACELPAKHGLPLSRWSTGDSGRPFEWKFNAKTPPNFSPSFAHYTDLAPSTIR